jgi:hypothetical protein
MLNLNTPYHVTASIEVSFKSRASGPSHHCKFFIHSDDSFVVLVVALPPAGPSFSSYVSCLEVASPRLRVPVTFVASNPSLQGIAPLRLGPFESRLAVRKLFVSLSLTPLVQFDILLLIQQVYYQGICWNLNQPEHILMMPTTTVRQRAS